MEVLYPRINEFYEIKASTNSDNLKQYDFLLHSSYDDLIEDIRKITLPNKYIESLSVSCYTDEVNSPHFSRADATFVANECEGRCQQCFSGSEEDCLSCKTPYLISSTKCTDVTGFYFKVPSLDKNLDVITLNTDLSTFKEIVEVDLLGNTQIAAP